MPIYICFSKYGEVIYEVGCGETICKNECLIYPAVKAAKKADATILVVGLDLSIEAESLDRVDLLLPGFQTQLINQVASESKGPVILVIMSAGVDIGFARDNPNIRAIIWAGYSGQEGARAIADVVFGKYNPGGRLPLTWHENGYVEMLPMTSMRLRPVDNLVSRPSTLSDQGGRVGKAYDRGKGSKGHYGTAGKAGGLAGRESYHPGRGPGKTGTITGVGRASGQDVTRRVTQGRPRGGPRYFEVPNKALEVPGDSRRLHTSPGRSGRLRRGPEEAGRD
ncbi:hypothetical protein RD792_002350 [Penstemon davidsonii]|uniref:Glycoside hydrolase family 3 C-terminal domain-containing protein n=1 Tax=Penstemon davidsonii TaxID=160366 RepID=A0ABR0DQV8_9LAMI|nr:hypothetical protein RD792_002350 [Penstemon davidsonii]